jgi:DNA polymerase III epsilon subunit-like protein
LANRTLQLYHQSVLVKPVNTPITPLCTSLTTLTWEHVRNAGTFKDAIVTFDNFIKEHLVPKDGSADPPNFAFVALTPWDLRVQLPREARDKNVVLPAYLQHPILFGLRGEYQTFQSHHPETLAFSSSSLSSICAGLEVEEVRSSGKVTGGLPFHLQALAPNSPRRALEEAATLTRCLRSLIQKSRPSQSNPQGTPGVMSRPLDARSDVRAFLGERSKVLHLSGLPHDTTQSELESWFTQYGGRPIAFWTLRTPEGGKPSGSGFVVFGSHEEVSSLPILPSRADLLSQPIKPMIPSKLSRRSHKAIEVARPRRRLHIPLLLTSLRSPDWRLSHLPAETCSCLPPDSSHLICTSRHLPLRDLPATAVFYLSF